MEAASHEDYSFCRDVDVRGQSLVWVVDYDRSVEAVGVLNFGMSVIPERASLIDDLKLVCEALAGWYRTLRYPCHAIHPSGVSLMDPMPVYGRAFVPNEIVDLDSHNVTRVDLDKRPWTLPIDEHHLLPHP